MPIAQTDRDPTSSLDRSTARESLVRQRDQTDCGVACLLSIIRYYGGEAKLERLREWSGTGQDGTTLLGLYQAAERVRLEPGAYEADTERLKTLDGPCILHVVKDGRLQHYVVCYGFDGSRFLIGDPASGVAFQPPEAVDAMWQSKALLVLKPTDAFETSEAVRKDQWRWLWRLVRDDVNILWLAAALGLIIAILSLSTAIFSQKLIDEILPDKNRLHLGVGLGLLVLLLMARNGLTYVRQRFLVRQTRDFNNRVIDHFYGSLLRLPQPFFFNRKVGDLIARMNDTRRLQRAITYVLGDRMIDALLLLVASGFILNYAWPLGLMALTSLPLFGLLAYLYHDPIVQGQRRVMEAHAANESNYVNTIEGMATIKAQNKEDVFTRITTSIYGFFQDQIYDLGRIGVRFNFWAETVGTLIQVAVLGWSAYLVLSDRLLLGVLVAIFQMTSLLVPSAMRVALMNVELQEARVAFDRMHEFTSLEPEYEEPDTSENAPEILEALDVQHLAFRFPGRSPLLKDVSLSVHRGEMVALMGESGSGKTTLLHVLQRFYAPEAGTITINQRWDWHEISTPAWRDWIGIVPQDIKIFNGTLIDNIGLCESENDAEAVIDFCRDRGFHVYFSQFPQGYATVLGEEGANLSGGQQQLVALARALYTQPQLLVLDEPTAAMDRRMEASVLDLLSELKHDMAILLASHRTQSVRRADRIYVLKGGRVQTAGPPCDLAHGNNLFARSLADRAVVNRT